MCIRDSLCSVIYNERGVVMSIQEKIQEHVKEKCRYCLKEDCDGIHINTNNEATCERTRGIEYDTMFNK